MGLVNLNDLTSIGRLIGERGFIVIWQNFTLLGNRSIWWTYDWWIHDFSSYLWHIQESEKQQESLQEKAQRLESTCEVLQSRVARLLAEYSAAQKKMKQRLTRIEKHINLPFSGSSSSTINSLIPGIVSGEQTMGMGGGGGSGGPAQADNNNPSPYSMPPMSPIALSPTPTPSFQHQQQQQQQPSSYANPAFHDTSQQQPQPQPHQPQLTSQQSVPSTSFNRSSSLKVERAASIQWWWY